MNEPVKVFPKPVHQGPPTHAEGEFYLLNEGERQMVLDLAAQQTVLNEKMTLLLRTIMRAHELQALSDERTWTLSPDAKMLLLDKAAEVAQ
jgi:hypothetical protein